MHWPHPLDFFPRLALREHWRPPGIPSGPALPSMPFWGPGAPLLPQAPGQRSPPPRPVTSVLLVQPRDPMPRPAAAFFPFATTLCALRPGMPAWAGAPRPTSLRHWRRCALGVGPSPPFKWCSPAGGAQSTYLLPGVGAQSPPWTPPRLPLEWRSTPERLRRHLPVQWLRCRQATLQQKRRWRAGQRLPGQLPP